MKLHCVENMDQVLLIALERPLPEIASVEGQPIPPIPPVVEQGPTAHQ